MSNNSTRLLFQPHEHDIKRFNRSPRVAFASHVVEEYHISGLPLTSLAVAGAELPYSRQDNEPLLSGGRVEFGSKLGVGRQEEGIRGWLGCR